MFHRFLRPIEPNYSRSARASDRAGFVETLGATPLFVENAAETRRWARRRGITMSPAEALEPWAPSAFEGVVDAVRRVHGNAAAGSLRDVEIAAVDSREPVVSTHGTVGRPLIVWNSSFGSLLGLLDAVAPHCGPATSRSEDLASLAVVRFFVLQQVFHRMSTTHQARGHGINRKGWGQELSTWFVLAQEAGHVALSHTGDVDRSLEQELEADSFAWFVYRDIARAMRRRGPPPLAPVVAALLAAEGIERATFVRRPSTHPTFQQRLAALAVHEPALLEESLSLRALVAAACDPDVRMGDEAWECLASSSVWRTDVLPPSTYETSRVLDTLLGAEPGMLATMLEGIVALHPGLLLTQLLPAASRSGLPTMLEACGVCGVDVEPEWSEKTSPVALPNIVDAFVDAGCWGNADSEDHRGHRIMASALSSLLLRSCLHRP